MKNIRKIFSRGSFTNANPATETDAGIQYFAFTLFGIFLIIYVVLLTSLRVDFTGIRFLLNTIVLISLSLFLVFYSRFTARLRIMFLTLVMIVPSLAELFILGLLSFGKTVFLLAPILLAVVFEFTFVFVLTGIVGVLFLLAALGFSFGWLNAPEPDRIMRPLHLVLDSITLLSFAIAFIVIIDKLRVRLIQTFVDIRRRNLELQEAEKSLVIMRDRLNESVRGRMTELEEAKEMLLEAKQKLSEQNEIILNRKASLDETYQKIQMNQANLVQSRKMASLGTLSLGIAHEINNPLNFIHGSLMVLEKKLIIPEDHQLAMILPIMKDATSKINKIVKSLHQFGPKEQQTPSPCDLRAIISNCLNLLKPQLHHEIQINILNPDFNSPALGLPEKLHQVFLNILHNAIQAVPNNGIIQVSFIAHPEEHTVVTRITDNGPGIPADLIEKITEPFFTTKPVGKGTGLGLYISKQIISNHQGRMTFESTYGQGTSVVIVLPMA